MREWITYVFVAIVTSPAMTPNSAHQEVLMVDAPARHVVNLKAAACRDLLKSMRQRHALGSDFA